MHLPRYIYHKIWPNDGSNGLCITMGWHDYRDDSIPSPLFARRRNWVFKPRWVSGSLGKIWKSKNVTTETDKLTTNWWFRKGILWKCPDNAGCLVFFSKLPSKWFIWMLFLGFLKTLTLKWWSCNAQRIYHNLPTWPLFAIHQCDIRDILIQDIGSVKLKSLDPLPMIHLSSFQESLCFRQPLTASGHGPISNENHGRKVH